MNEIKIAITWHLCPMTQIYINFFKLNECPNFYSHKYAVTLVSVKLIIFMSLNYMHDGYFVSSILTNHQASWNINVHKNKKSVRENEIVLFQADSCHYNHAYLLFKCICLYKITFSILLLVLWHQITAVWCCECIKIFSE